MWETWEEFWWGAKGENDINMVFMYEILKRYFKKMTKAKQNKLLKVIEPAPRRFKCTQFVPDLSIT